MVNAWNVGELDQMVLPPCHYGFQVYTREMDWYKDLDKIKEIYVNWSLSKGTIGYAGDLKADTIESANQIFTDGWQNRKDPFAGKPLVELECFASIPKRAISLMWNQRSVDTGLGLSFNIASYGLLLMMIAKQVNMVPDELIGSLGDVHLYLNHIEPIKDQLTREPYPLPTVKLSNRIVNDISEYTLDDIILENYQSHPTIKMPLSN
jgi:thymidylate synthase